VFANQGKQVRSTIGATCLNFTPLKFNQTSWLCRWCLWGSWCAKRACDFSGQHIDQSIPLDSTWKSHALISSHVNFDPHYPRFNDKYSSTKHHGLANGVTGVAGRHIWLVFPHVWRSHEKFNLAHDESHRPGFPPTWTLIHTMSQMHWFQTVQPRFMDWQVLSQR